MKEVKIDGVEYVRKSDVNVPKVSGKYVIIRTYSAGCFAGSLSKKTQTVSGVEVLLKGARRLWYWKGAASLSQLAVDGTSCPSDCKFPCEVPEITLPNTIEIIPCTEKAKNSIKGVPIWTG